MFDRKKVENATHEEMVSMFKEQFERWRKTPMFPADRASLERTISEMEEMSNWGDCCIHLCADCQTISSHSGGPCDNVRIVRCGCVAGVKPWSPG